VGEDSDPERDDHGPLNHWRTNHQQVRDLDPIIKKKVKATNYLQSCLSVLEQQKWDVINTEAQLKFFSNDVYMGPAQLDGYINTL